MSNRIPEPDPDIQREILSELSDGPKSFDELKESLYGCEECGRHGEVSRGFRASWKELHDEQKIHLTLDRRVALGGPTG